MKNPNPIRQLEILQQSYVNIVDVFELYPFSKGWAMRTCKEINADLKKRNISVITSNKIWIPLKELLKKYPIDERRLKEAVAMKQRSNSTLVLNDDAR